MPGKYKVSIVAKAADTSKVFTRVKKPSEGAMTEEDKKTMVAVYPQKVAARALAAGKSLIPAKYNSPETSGLTYEVKPQSNSGADFHLKD